ncbi:MAG: hypothetical protein Q7T53_10415 [Deltaproteobacteria bacterium]|nr:hypothetical protein [Deltaproteobacteria bacterium]
MNDYFDQQEKIKKHQERRKELIERDLPYDIAKYQHKLALDLLQEQHQLNLDIHDKQAKLTKFITYMTITATLLATLLGVGLGWYLSTKSEAQPKTVMQLEQLLSTSKSVQEQVAGETSLPLHHKEISESSGQAASFSKNVSSTSPVKKK